MEIFTRTIYTIIDGEKSVPQSQKRMTGGSFHWAKRSDKMIDAVISVNNGTEDLIAQQVSLSGKHEQIK